MPVGEVASAVLERVGGRILWYTEAKAALATDPEILAAREHRLAGLERAALICCEPGGQPGVLSSELQR